MASESETARQIHAQFGVEFSQETRKAYERIDKLWDALQAARDKVVESGSDEDKAAYRKAKRKFSDARVTQRQAEEADPDHPRTAGGLAVAATVSED